MSPGERHARSGIPVHGRNCANLRTIRPSGGAHLGAVGPAAGGSPSTVAHGRRRATIVIAVAIVAVLAVPAAQLLGPTSMARRSFNLTNGSPALASGVARYTFPFGSGVQISWVSESGNSVVFAVIDSTAHAIYVQDAANGTGVFWADGGAYTFKIQTGESTQTVHVSGTY